MHDLLFPKRFALAIYVLAFSIGVLTHALDFIRSGPRPYDWGPFPLEIFWTSLILLDALVIVSLLTGKLKTGLAFAVIIMAIDVGVNYFAMSVFEIEGFGFAVLLQVLFFGFVLGSVGFLWPWSGQTKLPIVKRNQDDE